MALNPHPDNVIDLVQPPPTRYRVEWGRLVGLLLPEMLRKPIRMAWMRVLTAPVAQMHADFVRYIWASRRELSYNSQVMCFERALNDRFDPSRRRIRIQNADTEYAVSYDNFRYEQQPEQYLRYRREMPPYEYDRNWAEYSGQTDFTVIAPRFLQPRATELRALINRLRPANRRYQLLFQNL